MVKTFKMFCENMQMNNEAPARINLRYDEDMFQERHGAYYVNGYKTTKEKYDWMKNEVKKAWTGRMLEHYEFYEGLLPQSVSGQGLKYFINGLEVGEKDFWRLRSMTQEVYGISHFGKADNFDCYCILNDGSLAAVATR